MFQEVCVNDAKKFYYNIFEDEMEYNLKEKKLNNIEFKNKILICGGRDYDYYEKMRILIEKINPDCIVQGGAKGADSLAKQIAKKININCMEYSANWSMYGKKAGPIRNRKMLDDNPDVKLVIAFHGNIMNSTGTKDMVNYARKKGYKVKIVDDTPFTDTNNILDDKSIITYENKKEKDETKHIFTGTLF